jgi:hypothetical protein
LRSAGIADRSVRALELHRKSKKPVRHGIHERPFDSPVDAKKNQDAEHCEPGAEHGIREPRHVRQEDASRFQRFPRSLREHQQRKARAEAGHQKLESGTMIGKLVLKGWG